MVAKKKAVKAVGFLASRNYLATAKQWLQEHGNDAGVGIIPDYAIADILKVVSLKKKKNARYLLTRVRGGVWIAEMTATEKTIFKLKTATT